MKIKLSGVLIKERSIIKIKSGIRALFSFTKVQSDGSIIIFLSLGNESEALEISNEQREHIIKLLERENYESATQ
jgi:hypothetical protein